MSKLLVVLLLLSGCSTPRVGNLMEEVEACPKGYVEVEIEIAPNGKRIGRVNCRWYKYN